jgi:excisionase family DNA binding protein
MNGPMNNDEQFERNQEIIKKVSQGMTMVAVGAEYGVSKQRIEQIYRRGSKKDPALLTIAEYCKQNNVSKSKIHSQIDNNEIEYEKIGGKYYIKNTIKVTKICGNCGERYNPTRRFRYCTEECRDMALVNQHKKALWRRFNRLKKEKDRFSQPDMV